jgi:hypothetical protein
VNIESAFPSAYLKASDLNGQAVVVKIATVRIEKVGDDQRPILYFVGKDKGVVLNKSNKNAVVGLYGPETDHWTGQPVELFVAMVDYQGKQVEAIRIRQPRGVPLTQRPAPAQGMYSDANPPPAGDVPF